MEENLTPRLRMQDSKLQEFHETHDWLSEFRDSKGFELYIVEREGVPEIRVRYVMSPSVPLPVNTDGRFLYPIKDFYKEIDREYPELPISQCDVGNALTVLYNSLPRKGLSLPRRPKDMLQRNKMTETKVPLHQPEGTVLALNLLYQTEPSWFVWGSAVDKNGLPTIYRIKQPELREKMPYYTSPQTLKGKTSYWLIPVDLRHLARLSQGEKDELVIPAHSLGYHFYNRGTAVVGRPHVLLPDLSLFTAYNYSLFHI